jgi:hypothetical protein
MQSNKTANAVRNGRVSREKREGQDAIAELRKYMTPGTTVLTILRRVSASGMSRLIDIHVIVDNEPLRFTWTAARALGWIYDRKREALRVDGCGLDVGFSTVYNLSSLLHGDGYALKQRWL